MDMKIRNKFIKISGIICILVSIVGCNKETMEIKNANIIIEYGQTVSNNVSEYLNNTEEYCELVEISGLPDNEKDKSYPSVGIYEITFTHNKEQSKVTVEVKDTVAPVITNLKDSYTVDFGKSFKQEIKAEDLSDVTITVNDSKVNYKKAGEYKATVKAADACGNETEKEFVIKVKEEKKEEVIISTNKGQSSSNNSSNNNSTSSSNSNKNETSSNNQNSSSNENKNPYGWPDEFVIEVPDVDMENHEHDGPAVENMYFETCDELDEWAWNYLVNVLGHGGAYGVSDCSCGKVYINMFY